MFGMSFTEIVIIAGLALLLVGPDELPQAARKLGKVLREVKEATQGIKSDLSTQLDKAGGSEGAREALGAFGELRKLAGDTTAALGRELMGEEPPRTRPVYLPAPPPAEPPATPAAGDGPAAAPAAQEAAPATGFRQVSLADLAGLTAPVPVPAPVAAPTVAPTPAPVPAPAPTAPPLGASQA